MLKRYTATIRDDDGETHEYEIMARDRDLAVSQLVQIIEDTSKRRVTVESVVEIGVSLN